MANWPNPWNRWTLLAPLAGFAGLVAAALLLAGGLGAADTPPGRIPFQIATGSTSGAFFPVGEAIAGISNRVIAGGAAVGQLVTQLEKVSNESAEVKACVAAIKAKVDA